MRINELLSENNQIDELSLAGVGQGIKTAAGKLGRGIEAGAKGLAKGAGYIAGAPSALGQQYQAGKQSAMTRLGTDDVPAATGTAAATGTTPTAIMPQAATGTAPQTVQQVAQSAISVKQINKVIPTLRVRDLTSVKKTVDTTLAQKQKVAATPAPTAPGSSLEEIAADQARLASGTNENRIVKRPVAEFHSNFFGTMI